VSSARRRKIDQSKFRIDSFDYVPRAHGKVTMPNSSCKNFTALWIDGLEMIINKGEFCLCYFRLFVAVDDNGKIINERGTYLASTGTSVNFSIASPAYSVY